MVVAAGELDYKGLERNITQVHLKRIDPGGPRNQNLTCNPLPWEEAATRCGTFQAPGPLWSRSEPDLASSSSLSQSPAAPIPLTPDVDSIYKSVERHRGKRRGLPPWVASSTAMPCSYFQRGRGSRVLDPVDLEDSWRPEHGRIFEDGV